MTSRITWLCSYPKSGNTWLRYLLLNLVFGPQSGTTSLQRLIPDVHETRGQLKLPLHDPGLVKVHLMLDPEVPILSHSAGCIYMVRNPVDVMLSNLNYAYWSYAVEQDDAKREQFKQQYITEFLQQRGDPRWRELAMGGWDEHVLSWLGGETPFPRLVIRYEDMIRDPLAEVIRVNEFLVLGKNTGEIRAAIDASSFERMKLIEEKEISSGEEGFFYSKEKDFTVRRGNRFMNRSRCGEGWQEIDPQQREAVVRVFGPLMDRLGYIVDRDDNRISVRNPGRAVEITPGWPSKR